MPVENYNDWKDNQRYPFDDKDQYKYGNYSYVEDDFMGNAKLTCNKCGAKHRLPYDRLMKKNIIRCKCGNR